MTSPPPRIAITTTNADNPAVTVRAYGTAVERAGGSPAYVVSNATRIAEYLAEFDGFVLSGGVDIEPTRYGGQRLASVDEAVPARDEFELALVPELIDRGAPTLAICRGLQAVNVALGGSLIEDLPTELGERYRIKHQQSKELAMARDSYAPQHEVRLESQSALAQLLGRDRFLTNSMHHQAVRTVAPSLRAVGWTDDGIVEAIDPAFAHPFFVCVQWHPEALPEDRVSRRLFDGLVAAAGARLRERAALERT